MELPRPTLLSIGFSHSVVLLFLEKHLWGPQPQGSLRTKRFSLFLPLPPGHLDTARMWSLHGAHEHNEKEGSQRKKWRLTAAGRLSIFISNLMGVSHRWLLLSCLPSLLLAHPLSEALGGEDPLFITSHLHTQPPSVGIPFHLPSQNTGHHSHHFSPPHPQLLHMKVKVTGTSSPGETRAAQIGSN